MSDIIHLLPDSLANQIAAGEVIQRPASVVKELLENAVDAGADNIKLIVKDSGKTLIQVIDNGCGMTETDARMSFERHATSKIQEPGDLFRIATMGFRGEALASIAAVSMTELITRPEEAELGVRILLQGSVLQKQEYCSSPVGTNISVKKLFFNTPARRKFLKSDPVEFRHITEEFQRVAMACPSISFSLHHNDKRVLHLPTANLRQRLVGVFGKNSNENLVPIEEETEVVNIRGFVGKPRAAKKKRGEQYFFVNNRFFKSPYLHHAVLNAYENLLLPEHYPLYALYFEMEPEKVDVNVHPTKQEIKFEDESLIYHYLKVSIRHALGKFSVIPAMDFEGEPAFISPGKGGASGDPAGFRTSHSRRQQWEGWEKLYDDPEVQAGEQAGQSGPAIVDPSTEEQLASAATDSRTPFQIHNKYILSPVKAGFLLIHQHHAHSRILFERFREALRGQNQSSQKLLFPETIHLSQKQSGILRSSLDDLRSTGFEIDIFGQDAFIIHGMPELLSGEKAAASWIEAFLEIYLEEEMSKWEPEEKLAWCLAKPVAIRAGQRLSAGEMNSLIDGLFACDHPFRTPKGRLCFIQYSMDSIDRQFKS